MINIASVFDRTPYLNHNSTFIVSVLTIMTGGIIAQVINFITVPVIARLFTPEHFGVMALFLSLGSIFTQSSCLCYNQAIILPKEDVDAVKILMLSVIILISLCGFLTLCSTFIVMFVPEHPWVKNLGGWLSVVPLSIIFQGFILILSSWNIRKKQYTSIAKSDVLAAIVRPSIRIGAGVTAGSSFYVLIAGLLIGAVSKIGVLLNGAKNTINKDLFKIRRSEIYHVAKEYRDFPVYSLPAALLNNFTQNLVVILLGYFFSPAIIGYYAMGYRLIEMPMNILVSSVQRVYMQKISELKNQGNSLRGSFMKTTAGLFLLGCVPFLIIVLWGQEIFSIFLGERWITAGTYAILLSPWLFSKFILPPSNAILIVTRHNRFRFYYQFFAIILKGFSIFLGFSLFDEPEPVLLIYSLASAAVNLGLIAKAFSILRKNE